MQNPTVATHTQLIEVRCATDVRSEEQCVSGTRNPPPQVARPEAVGKSSQRGDPARAASPPQRELVQGPNIPKPLAEGVKPLGHGGKRAGKYFGDPTSHSTPQTSYRRLHTTN